MESKGTTDISHPEPSPITRNSHHEKVLEILSCMPRGLVLDVPCGHGSLTQKLLEKGFEVECADIDPALFRLDNRLIKFCNLNESVPFDKERFDIVTCVAGIHRIYKPAVAVREFRRVLKKEGMLLISFPNYAHLRRRLKFLLRGYLSRGIEQGSFLQTIEDEESRYRGILLFPQIKRILEGSGFLIDRVETDRHVKRMWLYFLLIGIIQLSSCFASKKKKAAFSLAEINSGRILLGGNNLILLARKQS